VAAQDCRIKIDIVGKECRMFKRMTKSLGELRIGLEVVGIKSSLDLDGEKPQSTPSGILGVGMCFMAFLKPLELVDRTALPHQLVSTVRATG
jgi:hypothetical protein